MAINTSKVKKEWFDLSSKQKLKQTKGLIPDRWLFPKGTTLYHQPNDSNQAFASWQTMKHAQNYDKKHGLEEYKMKVKKESKETEEDKA